MVDVGLAIAALAASLPGKTFAGRMGREPFPSLVASGTEHLYAGADRCWLSIHRHTNITVPRGTDG